MAYYEITSAGASSNSTTGPASIKPLAALRQANDYGIGWDEAGGSSDNILAESNLTSSELLTQNESIPLGNIFKTPLEGRARPAVLHWSDERLGGSRYGHLFCSGLGSARAGAGRDWFANWPVHWAWE